MILILRAIVFDKEDLACAKLFGETFSRLSGYPST